MTTYVISVRKRLSLLAYVGVVRDARCAPQIDIDIASMADTTNRTLQPLVKEMKVCQSLGPLPWRPRLCAANFVICLTHVACAAVFDQPAHEYDGQTTE